MSPVVTPPFADPDFGFFYPWLLPKRGVYYDALRLFVHPHDGYRLSDRIWRTDQITRNRIDNVLRHEILNGTSAVKMAELFEQFLKPERVGIKTAKPYGQLGSFDARRLARTEITAAHGRATIASAHDNPFVEVIRWALSYNHQDWPCNCEENSTRDEEGLGPGRYQIKNLPDYPDHPHCMCNLQMEVVAKLSQVVQRLRDWVEEPEPTSEIGKSIYYPGLLYELLKSWGMRQFVTGGLP